VRRPGAPVPISAKVYRSPNGPMARRIAAKEAGRAARAVTAVFRRCVCCAAFRGTGGGFDRPGKLGVPPKGDLRMEIRGGELERGSVVPGYRVDGVISRGGMGVVYRVTNVAQQKVYALKTLAPELTDDAQFRDRFKREIRIAASIEHPNVVGIHYAGEHDGVLFLVTDFVYATELQHLLEESGALEPDRAVDLLVQFASALDAAHAKGLVHRDVKPANMLISVRDGQEHGYLTDFGVAKRSDNIGALTSTGTVVGTVHYMAPEQVTGNHTDARTDVYALGCVFYQMLTGAVPYERENTIATLSAHVHDPTPALPDELAALYPTFGGVIEKAMAKKPGDRYLSAGDFARDAAAALSGMRYTGPATVVATGDAKPLLADEEPQPTPTSQATRRPHTTVPSVPVQAMSGQEGAASEGAAAVPGVPTVVSPPSAGAPTDTPAAVPGVPTVVSAPTAGAPTEAPAAAVAAGGGGGPVGRRSHRYKWAALVAFVALAGVVAAVIAITSGGSSSSSTTRGFAAAVRPVPTNRVNGMGSATVQLHGNVATVTVDTNGLLRAAHLMHIHGGTGNCPPASAAVVYNGHRFISASVGDKFYGPVVTSLTEDGDTSPALHLTSSLFPQVGNIRYERTFTLGPGVAQEIRNGLAVIVVHGIDYDGAGVYDGYLGPGVEATAPALCGPLFPVQTAAAPRTEGGNATTYTASLRLYGPTPSQQSLASLFWCHGSSSPVPASASARESGARAPT
jgi:serine/threonine protein kinase